MTLKSGTEQACAACKYQRRRCNSDCSLAPHFPADQPKMFQNAHKLFGVKNILKLLKQLDPTQRVIAMKSIKYQAYMRDRFPVYGCLVEIQQLYCQIQAGEEELQAVLAQLSFYRRNHQQRQEISLNNEPPSQLQLGVGIVPPENPFSLLHKKFPQSYNAATALPTAPQPSYSDNGNAAYNINILDSKEDNMVNNLWIQQTFSNSNNNNANSMAMQSQLTTSEPLSVQQEMTQDYEEIHPFFDTIDDRQSYIDSKDVYESSSESSMKDTRHSVQQMAENELKNAACFGLTSFN
ncbi:LOB domain-containing 27-like [Olea europaea subsp. europaea]|uniref:LOB domain-containing 27-like n=1 Tax=Olea europaea subsp. europaea TaxID=158383 RepID=A0A8S0SBM9_OLEEU|nr:LOB domain-containing 27-like [Olea europaea subsp. europaea]